MRALSSGTIEHLRRDACWSVRRLEMTVTNPAAQPAMLQTCHLPKPAGKHRARTLNRTSQAPRPSLATFTEFACNSVTSTCGSTPSK